MYSVCNAEQMQNIPGGITLLLPIQTIALSDETPEEMKGSFALMWWSVLLALCLLRMKHW